jgi:Lrp/AsnC family transcriptional regulator of lysine biosynthesis
MAQKSMLAFPQGFPKREKNNADCNGIRSISLAEVQKSLNGNSTEIMQANAMDEKDKQIIKILKDNGRAGYIDIGKKIRLSEGAVRKRIKTLAKSGVIRKFTVKVGVAEGAEAIALVSVNPSLPTQEVSKKIQAIPNVETIYEVTGEYDIVAVISGMNVVEVNECIEKIRRVDGIMKSNTMIVLRSW